MRPPGGGAYGGQGSGARGSGPPEMVGCDCLRDACRSAGTRGVATVQTVTLDQLNTVDGASFIAALADGFEQSPWIVEAAVSARPFSSLEALFDTLRDIVGNTDSERQTLLI